MGGHGHGDAHGHHAPPYFVPKADIYKIEDAPEMMKLQADLAKKGLSDPWARNHVWRYQKKFGTKWSRFGWMMFRGVPIGVIAFGITIAVENYLGIDYHPWHHHDSHGDHGKSEH